jgi:hypothetical protein
MQIDQSLYLDSSNINKEGLDTQHQVGNTCSRKTTDRVMTVLAEQHCKRLDDFFSSATKNEWLLVLIIDDFTKIHTNRRPLNDKASDAVSMCTIVIKAYKNLKGIKLPKNIFNVHHSNGLNIQACQNTVTSPQSMGTLTKSYSSSMPQWITLEEHSYCDDKKVRSMENLQLVNFIELQLKSKEGFAAALMLHSCTCQWIKTIFEEICGGSTRGLVLPVLLSPTDL